MGAAVKWETERNGLSVNVETVTQAIGDHKDQDVDYEEIVRMTYRGDRTHKLRIRIRSNSYEFQCYSIIDRWDGSKWHQLHKLQERKTGVGMASRLNRGDHSNKEFQADRDELIRVAKEVLAP